MTGVLNEYARDTVRRLRVFDRESDALSTRRSIERALASTALSPRDLLPGSILCVRQLRAEVRHRHGDAWTAGLQTRVAGLVASAARPYREMVPLQAAAVFFRDEAELLACLARDWSNGGSTSWWWTGLFGKPVGRDLLRHVFLENARFVPAAVDMLVRDGRALDLFPALGDDLCDELERTMAIAYGLSIAPATLRDRPAEPTGGMSTAMPAREREAAHGVVRVLASLPATAFASLSRAQQRVLAVALLVQRAPEVVRRDERVADVIAQAVLAAQGSTADPPSIGVLPTVKAIDSDVRRVVDRPDRDVAPMSRIVAGPALDTTPPSVPGFADRLPPQDAPQPEACVVPAVREPTRAGGLSPAAPLGEPFVTRYGGAFYVINVLIAMGIVGDFTQPSIDDEDVRLWRLLARIADRVSVGFREDPLWSALRVLDGRDDGTETAEQSLLFDRAVDGMTPDLEHYAARVLDHPEGTALAFLCAAQAHVHIGRTRVEACFSLAAHPISIRMAGLDRNPGWVPAAGRVISFQYD